MSAPAIQWSSIEETPTNIEKLLLLCNSHEELRKVGYVMEELSEVEICRKVRCRGCYVRKKKRGRSSKKEKNLLTAQQTHQDAGTPPVKVAKHVAGLTANNNTDPKMQAREATSDKPNATEDNRSFPKSITNGSKDTISNIVSFNGTGKSEAPTAEANTKSSGHNLPSDRTAAAGEAQNEEKISAVAPTDNICYFHPGKIRHSSKASTLSAQHHTFSSANLLQTWSCCHQYMLKPGCVGRPEHDFESEHDADVRANWLYHRTQSAAALSTNNFTPTPTLHNPNHRTAIALDVEMGIALNSDPEVIRLTVIDFFTGTSLIDTLVLPSVPLKHLNTRYSGITTAQMATAVRNKTCLFGGWDAARAALFQFMGPQTVVVMHGGSSDFNALRIIHEAGMVVDTLILAGYHGVGKTEGGRSLKNLVKLTVGVDVQMGRGHCSLEDTWATRELVVRLMQEIPDE